MSQTSVHRPVKRATLLTKRTQYLKKYYKERSCKPLHEKLKNNNIYLAKALSKEKQTCQSLFSQNIALIAEVQELRLACNTRDNIISNIMTNQKEMLKMIVSMSGYVTNSISMCQEFTSGNLMSSCVSPGRKESSRRLSIKSPNRGVVKPMVSGHTITKPTINLSRVNMQHINNTSRLSDIQELSTPDRSQEINEERSPISVSMPIAQLRYENNSSCRLPERITISSPRTNVNDERKINRKRSLNSDRISKSYSKSTSNRWSNETVRTSIGLTDQLANPRVKLNDVSKLLRNSQRINIRTLFNNRISNIEIEENNNDTLHGTSDRNISETQMSINLNEQNETHVQKESKEQTTGKTVGKDFNANLDISKNSSLSLNENWQDPLEGPSWLFNNTLTVTSPNNGSEPDHLDDFHDNNRISQNNLKATIYSDESSDGENTKEMPSSDFSKYITNLQTQKKNQSFVTEHIRDDSFLEEDAANDTFCTSLPTMTKTNQERNFDNTDDNGTTNLAHFVTLRRGRSKVTKNEVEEDFTLLLRQPRENIPFDINELQLPVLEKSILNPTISTNEVDTEVTTTIKRITNIRMPSISNRSMNESEFDQITTIKLPVIQINEDDGISMPIEVKKAKISDPKDDTNHFENAATINTKTKMGHKSQNNKNPSAVKVVLEKLEKTLIRQRTPSPIGDTRVPNRPNNFSRHEISNEEENSELENNSSSNYCLSRPRRKKAPVNLKEPGLHTKMRRG